jgi:hypothetical protein
MGMPASSNTFSAPMCAKPLAPPPLSTTPTVGRDFLVSCPKRNEMGQRRRRNIETRFRMFISDPIKFTQKYMKIEEFPKFAVRHRESLEQSN